MKTYCTSLVGFQKQNLEVQKNMNSENPRVLRKNWFHWTKSVGKVIATFEFQLHSGLTNLTTSLLTNFRFLKSLENLLLLGDLPNLPF